MKKLVIFSALFLFVAVQFSPVLAVISQDDTVIVMQDEDPKKDKKPAEQVKKTEGCEEAKKAGCCEAAKAKTGCPAASKAVVPGEKAAEVKPATGSSKK